jgi:hypothetical protein
MISGAARPAIFALALLASACSSQSLAAGEEPPGVAGAPAAAGGQSAAGKGPGEVGGSSSPVGGAPPSASAGVSGSTMTSAGATLGGSPSAEPSRTRQKLEPEDGKTLLLVGQDTGEIESYASAFGVPAGVMLYSNVWDGLGVLQPSDFGGYGWSDLSHWRGKSERLVLQVGLDLDYGQNCGSCAGCSRAGHLEQLARRDGARVSMVRALAEALRDSGKPVLLRVGYEFDAEICPGGFGKYPMQPYQEAFRRVRSILNEVGADRVALVWNAWAFQARDPGKAAGVAAWGWYPGDDVVDWIGVSVFPGHAAGHATEQQQADKRRQLAEFARNHGKPLMIAEASPRARFAPAQGQLAWEGWFSGVFEYVEENQVKALSYINMNWEALGMWTGRGWGDSRVQGSPIAEQWKSATSAARFLKSSDSLYRELGL